MKSVLRPIDILRTGVMLAILGVILIGLNFFPKYSILPNSNYWDSTDPVEPNSIRSVGIGFIPKGHVFVGKITAWTGGWGGEQSRILVGLEDSLGNTIFTSALVNGTFSFAFEASKDDFYYLYFDNTNSSLGTFSSERKWVFWQIFYYGNYTLIFQISASIFWTSGIICIGLYLFKGKEPERRVKEIPYLAEEVIKKIVKRTKK